MSDTMQKFKAAENKLFARRSYSQNDPVKFSSKALLTMKTLASALAEVDIGEILPDNSRQTLAVGDPLRNHFDRRQQRRYQWR